MSNNIPPTETDLEKAERLFRALEWEHGWLIAPENWELFGGCKCFACEAFRASTFFKNIPRPGPHPVETCECPICMEVKAIQREAFTRDMRARYGLAATIPQPDPVGDFALLALLSCLFVAAISPDHHPIISILFGGYTVLFGIYWAVFRK